MSIIRVPRHFTNYYIAASRRLLREPVLLVAFVVSVGALFLLIVYPTVLVVLKGFEGEDGSFSVANFATLWQRPVMQKAVRNTLLLVVTSVPLGSIVGIFIGYLLTCTDLPARRWLRILITLPMIFPPFTGEMGLLLLFGRRGLITYRLLNLTGFSIYGAKGVILLQTIGGIPIISLIASQTFAAVSRDQEEAAQDLGADRLRTLFTVTLPMAAPGILSAILLRFISVISDFGTPMIVGAGFNPLAVEAYSQIMHNYDFALGAALSTALLVPAFIVFIIYEYLLSRRSFVTVTGRARTGVTHPLPWYVKCPALFFIAVIIFWNYSQLAVYLIGAFTKLFPRDMTFTLEHFKSWVDSARYLRNSVWTSAVAAVTGGLLASVLAYLIVRTRVPGSGLLDFLGTLPWGIPGTVKGVGYILAFHGAPFYWTGSYLIIILVNIGRSLPLPLRSNASTLLQLDPSLEEASMDLGASRLRTFFRITVPLISSAFFFSLLYFFKDCMTNLSSVIMLMSVKTELFYPHMFRAMTGGTPGAALAQGLEMFLLIIILLMVTAKMTGKSPLQLFQI